MPGAGLTGDTGPTKDIWAAAREEGELKAVLVETSFPNSMNDLAFKSALRGALGEQAMREHSAELTQAAIDINPGLVLAGILGFVASFAISLGPVYWVLLSEIFPNRARGPAMALAGFFNAMSSFVVQFVFPWELSSVGNAAIFFVYSALGLAAFLLLIWLLPTNTSKMKTFLR